MDQKSKYKTSNYKILRKCRATASWYWVFQWLLTLASQAKATKHKQTNCILWKLKFGTSKTIIGVRKDSEDCEKIFENHMSDKGLISGISRELWKLTKTKQSSQRWVNDLNRYFSCPWLVVLHNQIPDVGHISGQCFRGQVLCTVLPFGESLRNPVVDVSPTPQWSFLMFVLLWRCCI